MSKRVVCRFCENENKGKCSKKKNTSVHLNKRRKCEKFVASLLKEKQYLMRREQLPVFKEYEHRNLITGIENVKFVEEKEDNENKEEEKEESLILVP